ncbi:MAG: YceI family protein [Planctomycetota bacterium]|nr:YceI family protein [Planctomycetota bacterium]
MKPTYLTLILAGLLAIAWTSSAQSRVPSAASNADEALEFQVDSVHSGVLFRIEHMEVSAFYGRFTGLSGRYVLDADDPSGCEVQITIDTASADSASEGRDKHICGPDFLNAKQFPEATFSSTRIVAGEESTSKRPTYSVTGILNLRGVKGEVNFPMTLIGNKVTRMGHRSGLEGKLTIDRRKFGMESFPTEALSADIELTFFIEGLHK